MQRRRAELMTDTINLTALLTEVAEDPYDLGTVSNLSRSRAPA